MEKDGWLCLENLKEARAFIRLLMDKLMCMTPYTDGNDYLKKWYWSYREINRQRCT